MLDDFRIPDAELDATFEESPEMGAQPQARSFLGLTPVQRFVLSLMFFLMVCLLGTLCLLVTERMVPAL